MPHRLRFWLGRRWHLIGGVLLLAYFAYHGLHGERGLYAWVDKARELERARQELTGLQGEIADVTAKVAALQPDRVDPDLLEERLRKLGWIAGNEVIILAPPLPEGR